MQQAQHCGKMCALSLLIVTESFSEWHQGTNTHDFIWREIFKEFMKSQELIKQLVQILYF